MNMEENQNAWRNTATFSMANPTWITLGLNLGLHTEKQETEIWHGQQFLLVNYVATKNNVTKTLLHC
jgi:hypothetical protein